MKELVYTSARTGLRPGSSGFCTVAMSVGLPAAVIEFLERLSNTYRPVYMPYDGRAADNPEAISLIRARPGGQLISVLSRNAAAGADHTGRTNNLAHHLVFDGLGLTGGSNPGMLAAQPGAFLTQWDEQPRWLPNRFLDGTTPLPAICRRWQELTGDAGWAATVAAAWAGRDGRPLYVIYPGGTNVLSLLAEAMSLLPKDRQWDATFTTYYTGLPPEAMCVVRGVLAGTPQEEQARRGDHVDLMDLVGEAPDGSLAKRARGLDAVVAMPSTVAGEGLRHSLGSLIDSLTPPRNLELPEIVDDDEPPPAVLPAQGRPIRSSGRAASKRVRTGRGWGWAVALLFAALAVVGIGVGVRLAAEQRDSALVAERQRDTAEGLREDADQARAIAEKQREEAERAKAAADTRGNDAERRISQTVSDAHAKERAAAAEIDQLNAQLKSMQGGGGLMSMIQIALEEKRIATRNKRHPTSPHISTPPAATNAKSKDANTNFDHLIVGVEKLSAIDKLLLYRHLDSSEMRKNKEGITYGSFTLADGEIVEGDSQAKSKTKSVYVVSFSLPNPALMSGGTGYSFVRYYTSELDTGKGTPTYRVVARDGLTQIDMDVKYGVKVQLSPESEKIYSFYFEKSDLPGEVLKNTRCVFVMTDKNQTSRVFLLWRKDTPK